jgi:archaellum component FlaC
MTAMEDRKKFTYRPDSETEELLEQGLRKYNLTALNKLINVLVKKAMVTQPEEIQDLKNKIRDLNTKMADLSGEKAAIKSKYDQVRSLYLNIENTKEEIKTLLS